MAMELQSMSQLSRILLLDKAGFLSRVVACSRALTVYSLNSFDLLSSLLLLPRFPQFFNCFFGVAQHVLQIFY
jgi:hypothetical protein